MNELDKHRRALVLSKTMQTLAQELSAAYAGFTAAAIEHYKITGDALYLGCFVWQEGSEYRALVIPELLERVRPPKPEPVTIIWQRPPVTAPVVIPVTINGVEMEVGEGGHIAILTGTTERKQVQVVEPA